MTMLSRVLTGRGAVTHAPYATNDPDAISALGVLFWSGQ